MRKAILALLLVLVPLAVVPASLTFDAVKAFLLALGAVPLAAMALPRREEGSGVRFDLRWSAVTVAVGAALLLYAGSAFLGPDPWSAWRSVALLLAAAVVALAVENVIFDPGDLRPLLVAAATAGGIAAGYGLLQAAGLDFPFPWREAGRRDPVSTLGNPNWAAEFVAASIPVQALLAIRKRGRGRALAVLAILLGLGLLGVARGRAAFLGLALALPATAAVALVAGGAGRRLAGWALGAALLLGVVGGYGWFLSRGGELPAWAGRSDTAVVRADLARGTLRMLLDHPLGVGAGNWEAAHPPYRTEREYRASLFRDPGEAHCEPLQFAAEGGWATAAAALALAVLLVRAAVRGAAGPGRGEALALFASLAATAGASLFSAPLHRPASLLLAAFAAGGIAHLGDGRIAALGAGGAWARRAVVAALVAATLLLGQRMMAEGPASAAGEILRESDPLPPDRALAARVEYGHSAALDPAAYFAVCRTGELSLLAATVETDPVALRGHREAARDSYERALLLRPTDPEVLAALALARAGLGDEAHAEATWRRALAVAPWHRNANLGLGQFLLGKGRAAEALPLLEKALAVDPLHAEAMAPRAAVLIALGRDGEATERLSGDLDRLLVARPPETARARDAARRAAAGSPLLAEMVLGKAIRLLGGPDVPGGAALAMGVADGRPEESILDRAARGLEGAGRHGEGVRLRSAARFAAAEEALRSGDREKAVAEARRGTEVRLPFEESLAAQVRAASVLLRAGRRDEALGSLAAAVARGFDDPAALEGNPAFAPLRDDPAFRDLVKRAAARAARRAEK